MTYEANFSHMHTRPLAFTYADLEPLRCPLKGRIWGSEAITRQVKANYRTQP